jgi:hypothetical protein
MQDDENPYTSPKANLERIPSQKIPTNKPAKESMFNLDGAAMGLLIVSSFELLYLAPIAVALLLGATTGLASGTTSLRTPLSVTTALALCLRSTLIMISAFCMHKRRFYGFALLGAILPFTGIVFVPLWFSIPFGIWAFVILLRKDTRAAFAEAN